MKTSVRRTWLRSARTALTALVITGSLLAGAPGTMVPSQATSPSSVQLLSQTSDISAAQGAAATPSTSVQARRRNSGRRLIGLALLLGALLVGVLLTLGLRFFIAIFRGR